MIICNIALSERFTSFQVGVLLSLKGYRGANCGLVRNMMMYDFEWNVLTKICWKSLIFDLRYHRQGGLCAIVFFRRILLLAA